MDFSVFIAGKDDNERRLDRVIRKFIPADSLSGIYKAIRKGLVKVNDRKADASSRVFEGDSIKIASFLLGFEKSSIEKSDFSIPYDVVFKTEDLLIINKPYDVNVHGSENSIDKTIAEWYRNSPRSGDSLSFTPGPLHRLDRKTTGLLCFSLSLKGARWFSENIKAHNIKKTYMGIVEGHLSDSEGWIDEISREYDEKKTFQTVNVNSGKIDSKKSVTHVKPVSYGKIEDKECTLVQFDIETGRTHQIRSQSSFHGYPLIGDTAYNGSKISGPCDFFLHAYSLSFPENKLSHLPETLECPLPESFKNAVKNFAGI